MKSTSNPTRKSFEDRSLSSTVLSASDAVNSSNEQIISGESAVSSDSVVSSESVGSGKPVVSDGIASQPVLELEHVTYAYTKGGKRVLDDKNYVFHAGRVISITGPSGAGKTTLLSLLSGLTTPTSGRVLYRGKDLATSDRYRFRSRDIGVIFQSFNLLPALTVSENIILSMDASGKTFDRPKKQIAAELIAKVRLQPEYLNERILHLSGGEQQRVAIARALSYDPAVIIADEPTGNLDLSTQDDIMAIFRQLAHEEGKCVIIVTHSPEVAAQSDEVYQLAKLRRTR